MIIYKKYTFILDYIYHDKTVKIYKNGGSKARNYMSRHVIVKVWAFIFASKLLNQEKNQNFFHKLNIVNLFVLYAYKQLIPHIN